VYLGDQLEGVFNDIKEGKVAVSSDGGMMDLGLSQILPFTRDPGDRNRTSPFAFTGNRFEFRAVGSSQSVSGPLVAMNTMLADSLDWIADRIEAELADGRTPLEAVAGVLKEIMELHGAVIFGGDGYSADWHTMAVEERGLRNIPTTADALAALIDDDVTALFERTGVLSSVELESRYEVYAEQYILSIAVEAKLTAEIARTSVYPAALAYLRDLTTTVAGAAELGVELEATAVKTIAEEANGLLAAIAQLEAATGTHEFESTADHMQFCANTVRALMDGVRARADALEALIADEYWPLPKYREMLFIR
jgi:glutamine synthetase